MKRIFMGSLALACGVAFASSSALAAPRLPIGHSGRWITDASGRVVIVHGTNMVYKISPYYPAAAGFGDDDAAFLHRIGFNAVRVGVIWKAVEPRPGVYDNAYVSRIAATVAALRRHGILSLLDFHQDMYNERFQGEGAPDWAVQDDGLPAAPQFGFPANYELMPALQHAFDHFWANSRGLQNDYAGAWRHVAQRFAAQSSVLGYELFNEPFPGTVYASCALAAGCPAFDAKLTAFDRRVDGAIRNVDSRTLVFSEPNVLFDFGFSTHVRAPTDANAGFAFHDYCFVASSTGCSSEPKGFANAIAHVRRTREALLLTEFGASNATGDLTNMVRLADRNRVPWLEWAYCVCRDPTGSPSEGIVANPSMPPTGSNRVLGTLRSLVEPYPQVIAGIPLSWGFAPTARTFKLRYETAWARGRGRFLSGSVSEISTPALVYGGRYGVRVTGGAIISRRGASILRVASCPRARTITVTVTPSGRRRSSCKLRKR